MSSPSCFVALFLHYLDAWWRYFAIVVLFGGGIKFLAFRFVVAFCPRLGLTSFLSWIFLDTPLDIYNLVRRRALPVAAGSGCFGSCFLQHVWAGLTSQVLASESSFGVSSSIHYCAQVQIRDEFRR